MRRFIAITMSDYLKESAFSIDIKCYTGREFLQVHNPEETSKFKYYSNRSDFNDMDEVYFFVLYIDGKMLGLAHIRKNPYIEDTYWLSYLSTLIPDMGYASKLSEYIFQWFSDNNLQFETSSYNDSGFIKLKPLFNRLANKYNVRFIDKGKL